MTFETLQQEMYSAMKSGDKFRKEVISGLIADIKRVAIDKNCRDNITEEVVDKSNFRKKYSVYCTETAEVIRNKGFRPAKIFKCNIKDIENLYR